MQHTNKILYLGNKKTFRGIPEQIHHWVVKYNECKQRFVFKRLNKRLNEAQKLFTVNEQISWISIFYFKEPKIVLKITIIKMNY